MTDFPLYQDHSHNLTGNAQRNLEGRTHYVDADTLRFHHSRVLSAHSTDDGLLFYMLESVALDCENTKRGYRYVIFDLFGHVLSRVDLEHCFKRREQASKAMWNALNAIDAIAVTREGLKRQQESWAYEARNVESTLESIAAKRAA